MRALTFAMAAIAVMSLPPQGLGGVDVSNRRARSQTVPRIGRDCGGVPAADLEAFARKRRRAAQGKRGKRARR